MNEQETPPIASVTREEADRLYRATASIENLPEVFAKFVSDSAAFRARTKCVLDIPYGDDPDEILDIFLPANLTEKAPVHIFIHGGFWYQFGKNEWSFVAEALVDSGAIVIIPQYSLCPKVTIRTIVDQMRRMLVLVWRKIPLYEGDSNRLFVSGHSAGGHLATELSLTDWSIFPDIPSDILKGVCALSGIFDLRPIMDSFAQDHVNLSPFDAGDLSPLLNIRELNIPLILSVGQNEPEGFLLQTSEFSKAWQAAGNEVQKTEIKNCNHLDILRHMADRNSDVSTMLINQMILH